MADIHIGVNDELLERIQTNIGTTVSAEQIMHEALTLFLWASDEVALGRMILSASQDLTSLQRIVLTFEADAAKTTRPKRTELRLVVPSASKKS